MIKSSKRYENMVRSVYGLNSNTTLKWIARYPLSSPNRRHLFQIVKDIIPRSPCRVLDQGAAEGIVCKLLQDSGCEVLAVDIEPEFIHCWTALEIPGIVGNCISLDWWDGSKYDVVIAGVWVACRGGKASKLSKRRIARFRLIRNNWGKVLNKNGVVYFDVNPSKYPLASTIKIFEKTFSVSVFKNKPRCVLKCRKK